jgi:hypothetical protein
MYTQRIQQASPHSATESPSLASNFQESPSLASPSMASSSMASSPEWRRSAGAVGLTRDDLHKIFSTKTGILLHRLNKQITDAFGSGGIYLKRISTSLENIVDLYPVIDRKLDDIKRHLRNIQGGDGDDRGGELTPIREGEDESTILEVLGGEDAEDSVAEDAKRALRRLVETGDNDSILRAGGGPTSCSNTRKKRTQKRKSLKKRTQKRKSLKKRTK